MPRFLLGDELGNIKTIRARQRPTTGEFISNKRLYNTKLASAFSNGSCFLSTVKEDDTFDVLSNWKEPRSAGGKFIGIALTEDSTFTCTSNGMLRKSVFHVGEEKSSFKASESHCGTLPSRLFDWRLSADSQTFAYGGDEVDLSVWNTELAFREQSHPATTLNISKKRKRNDDLFPGEIWRARNVPNDHLGLRQPIRVTALSYLTTSSVSSNLIVGTLFGDLRRYDTRAARRPVSNWTGLAKVGGVKAIEKGQSDHELFISDGGSSLYSIDLRTGKILYGYHGISGAVSSMSPSATMMASAAVDRYVRIHSVIPPPPIAGSHQERKGAVLEKVYVIAVPTKIIWDKSITQTPVAKESPTREDDDDVWENMENVR